MLKGLKSLIAGIVAGTALGVLFSPKKGTDIRKNLKKEVKGGGIGLTTIKDTLVDMGKDIGDTYNETGLSGKLKKKATSAYSKVKSKAKKTYEKVKNQIINGEGD
ncbi:MAG: YtxH domain-containing protein [Patescibacteria group bacterium]